jgi:hypothetical protein
LDEDFDAATDKTELWFAWSPPSGKNWPGPFPHGWPNRCPAWAIGLAGLVVEPCMQIRSPQANERLDAQREEANHQKQLIDTFDKHGIIIESREIFPMPTVERERLTDPKFNEHVFVLRSFMMSSNQAIDKFGRVMNARVIDAGGAPPDFLVGEPKDFPTDAQAGLRQQTVFAITEAVKLLEKTADVTWTCRKCSYGDNKFPSSWRR